MNETPKISILLATYEPRLDWLKAQLHSINQQAYPNLQLYIRDDHSEIVPYAQIELLARTQLTKVPYEISRGTYNVGVNKTFEWLTQVASGDFFAYCDQDDIWDMEKLSVMAETMTTEVTLVCSDMRIIDESGRIISDSISKYRRRHRFRSGGNLAKHLLITNFVSGCAALVRADIARASVPFCPYMVYDHYLALRCANEGTVLSLNKPLIYHRIHPNNLTGVMVDVMDKKSYETVRIDSLGKRLAWLSNNLPCDGALQQSIADAVRWTEARKRNWIHKGGKRELWRYRRCGRIVSWFELFGARLPDVAFRTVIHLIKRNLI